MNELDKIALEVAKLDGSVEEPFEDWLLDYARRLVARLSEGQEPAMRVARNASGQIHMTDAEGNCFDMSKFVGQDFYTTPPLRQPDAEVIEAMKQAVDIFQRETDPDEYVPAQEISDCCMKMLAAIGRMEAAPTVPTIEQVEEAVGMGRSAWDTIDGNEIIAAVLRLAAAPQPAEKE